MGAPYDSRRVANFFLDKSPLTQMKLHKLLFYAHGWHLGFKSKPLLDEVLEAWTYGPVVPSIYSEFRGFGSRLIDIPAYWVNPETGHFEPVPPIESDEGYAGRLLERVWEVYREFTALQLSAMTHRPDSPWSKAREGYSGVVRYPEIQNKLIKKYFKRRIKKNRADG